MHIMTLESKLDVTLERFNGVQAGPLARQESRDLSRDAMMCSVSKARRNMPRMDHCQGVRCSGMRRRKPFACLSNSFLH